MAIGNNNIKGITIEFNGDTTKLGKALKKIETKTKDIDSELKNVNRALKFNPGNVELLEQKQTILKDRIKETKEQLEALKTTQSKRDEDSSVQKDSQEYRELQREIIETESKLKHFEGELKKVDNFKFEQLGKQFQNVGGKMKDVGKNVTKYVSAPAAAGLGAAVKVTMDFDTAMSQVAATMGKTTAEMENQKIQTDDFSGSLRDLAIEMGSKTAFSATEAAEALNYMALAGYDAETSAQMLPQVLNLAAAGSMDLARASDMVTDSQTSLGLSIPQTEKMIDQMAKTASTTNTSVEQLGDAILTIGPTAKSVKGGTAELNQTLGILADNGIKGSEAGTHLRNILLSMNTDKVKDSFHELGVEVYDSEGNLRSMAELFPEMAEAMDGLTSEERTGMLSKLFNKTDLAAINSLLDTNKERWNEVGAAIDNAGGSAGKMADTQLDNLGGSLTILKSALEGAAIRIGDQLVPAIQTVTEWITSLLEKFNSMPEGAQQFVAVAGVILAALGPVLTVGGFMLDGIGKFIERVPQIVGAVGKIGKAFNVLKTVLMGNPWILVAAAAIAAIVLIITHWDQIKEFFKKLWETIKNVATTAWTNIKNTVVGLVVGIKDGILGAFRKIGETIKTIVSTWFDIITWPYRKAWETIQKIAGKIKDVFNFKFKLPHIKLPHFSISPRGWKIGDLLKGSIPSLGIDWYADGAIFRSPTIIGNKGFGEAGAEAALPLDVLWDQMSDMFSNMADRIVEGVNAAGGMDGAVITTNVILDGKVVGRAVTPIVNGGLHDQSVLDRRRA